MTSEDNWRETFSVKKEEEKHHHELQNISEKKFLEGFSGSLITMKYHGIYVEISSQKTQHS